MADPFHGVLDDTGIHVDDTGGDGIPVVLIHGWPLSGESWADQVDPLVDAGHRVISYDRRGFGRSEPGDGNYDYGTLAADLDRVIRGRDLERAVLVGFSMGGGEVARYVADHGEERLRGVVFAAAVPPYLLQGDGNPDGPLPEADANEMRDGLEQDRDAFFDEFATGFFSVDGELTVTEEQRQEAIRLAKESDQDAALGCMDAWARTDFRGDLAQVTVPTLVLHGDSDATVPFEGSGKRTHEAIAHSELEVIPGAPHGLNVSHADQFNDAIKRFLTALA